MASFLNLRDDGGFPLRLREANFCGAVRWRAELLRASPGATIIPSLIAAQILNTELSRSQQRRKHFLIATFFEYLQRPALLGSTANRAAVSLANSTAKSRRDAGATNRTAKSTSPACPSGKQGAGTKSKEGAQPRVVVPRFTADEPVLTNRQSPITIHASFRQKSIGAIHQAQR
jgi:hypothetical protein